MSTLAKLANNWKSGIQLLAVALGLVLAGCAGGPPELDSTQSPYRYPLNSPGGKFSGLPPAVQNTVRAQVGSESIYDIRKDPGPVYRVLFVDDHLPPLLIAPDGSVLNPDLSVAVAAAQEDIGAHSGGPAAGLKPSDLPPNVMKVVQERAPNTEIAIIQKEKSAEGDVFVISFKDPVHYPALRIAADGTVLPEPKVIRHR